MTITAQETVDQIIGIFKDRFGLDQQDGWEEFGDEVKAQVLRLVQSFGIEVQRVTVGNQESGLGRSVGIFQQHSSGHYERSDLEKIFTPGHTITVTDPKEKLQ